MISLLIEQILFFLCRIYRYKNIYGLINHICGSPMLKKRTFNENEMRSIKWTAGIDLSLSKFFNPNNFCFSSAVNVWENQLSLIIHRRVCCYSAHFDLLFFELIQLLFLCLQVFWSFTNYFYHFIKILYFIFFYHRNLKI